MNSYSLIERVAQHLQRRVEDATRARARLHLLDWLGCVAGARQGPVADMARTAERDVLTRTALLGNVLEMDDVHRTALLHPGPVVWPAALSAVRETGGTMADLLDAGVRGYEAMIAIGATFDAHHYAHFHNTSTAGGFGGAAAAASAFGLDAQRTGWALANAGSTAGGLWAMRHADTMTKQIHAARAALEGLWFARLARAGASGPVAVLEGPQGLYAATVREPRPLVLGDGWRMAEVSFKPWAACRHVHPAIDCALDLRAAGQLSGKMQVATYADALAFCDNPHPVTEAQAKFSLQHGVAVIAAGRDAGPEDFTLAAIEALAPLRAQVTVTEDGAITARYPAHFGASLSCGGGSVALVDTRGDPERPASEAQIVAKARSLIAWGGLGDGDHSIEAAMHGDDPRALLALLDAWL
ncbi:MmgE/PrpD family protein [Glacieibacterium frigidum]|uniref:MmgE/PrpD family protein n=1 Tax=Glacieibacterium frigidum TaxID=2593303 RepID=A0A552UII2_9SPHN|nr:MmgE/PrpD family protein [Glacieibacterium frigidum]TRW18035.1 MmgE/PrpD family protein [Glacieibacterium frigidum]